MAPGTPTSCGPRAKVSTSPRLLVVGTSAHWSLESIYYRAFVRTRRVSTEFFSVERHWKVAQGTGLASRLATRCLAPLWINLMQQAFIRFLRNPERRYDIVLIFKGMEFSRSILEEARTIQPQAIWINLNPDDPLNVGSNGSTNGCVVDALSFFDLYLTWSRPLIERLQAAGCRRVEYLPFGYDEELHLAASSSSASTRGRIAFVGSWDKEREATLTKVADLDLAIYGASWARVARGSPLRRMIVPRNVFGAELSQIVRDSSVSLNLLRPQNAGAHNMRTFEIPAMRGLMLTTRSAEQRDYFPEGTACLMFNSATELREQVRAVQQDPMYAESIRRSGANLARSHTYTRRAVSLLQMLGAL